MTTTCTAASTANTAHNIAPPQQHSTSGYNFAAGYLRAFLTVSVVAFHAVIAYTSFAPPPPRSLLTKPQWWMAFPVVDSRRWPGFDAFVGFNDVFFMSLMFFLSGLFVTSSLRRKGASAFLRDRAVRLGAPFLVGVAVLAPLAYFPSYLMTGSNISLPAFGRIWLSLDHWPSGPAWFLVTLLAFDCLAAALSVSRFSFKAFPGSLFSRVCRTPAKFFGLLAAVSALAYIPMTLIFNSVSWTTFGPFTFQTSRILHYAAYFLIAVALGTMGLDRNLFARDGKLARSWLRWFGNAALIFGLHATIGILALSAHSAVPTWTALAGFTFALSCAASSLAYISFFSRFANRRVCMFDSLRDNAYGIYLVHYAFVSWLQYALLRTMLPAVAKGSIVFLGALALSWITVAALRRIPAVARII
jgi:peptidoglycan/LPS O-acetylase OafA/YrhL